jgi:hypothetical protein
MKAKNSHEEQCIKFAAEMIITPSDNYSTRLWIFFKIMSFHLHHIKEMLEETGSEKGKKSGKIICLKFHFSLHCSGIISS